MNNDAAHDSGNIPKGTGKFLGVPYDWRRPTWERVKQRWWNPNDNRIITPKSYGWGYDLNVHSLLRRFHLIR